MKKYRVSSAEMDILRILWENGPLTAKQVREKLPRHDEVAYSTVITTLQRMEAKGTVGHEKSGQGKSFLFSPQVKPEQVRKQAVRTLLHKYFDNDPIPVFATLVDTKKLKQNEIEQLKAMLDEISQKQKR